MRRNKKEKICQAIGCEIVRLSNAHGIKPVARALRCDPKTVRSYCRKYPKKLEKGSTVILPEIKYKSIVVGTTKDSKDSKDIYALKLCYNEYEICEPVFVSPSYSIHLVGDTLIFKPERLLVGPQPILEGIRRMRDILNLNLDDHLAILRFINKFGIPTESRVNTLWTELGQQFLKNDHDPERLIDISPDEVKKFLSKRHLPRKEYTLEEVRVILKKEREEAKRTLSYSIGLGSILKICARCKRYFLNTRKDRVYCSDSCIEEASRDRTKKKIRMRLIKERISSIPQYQRLEIHNAKGDKTTW